MEEKKSSEQVVKNVLDYYIYLYKAETLRELPEDMMDKFDNYIEKMRDIVNTQDKHPNIEDFKKCLTDAEECRKHMTLFEIHEM